MHRVWGLGFHEPYSIVIEPAGPLLDYLDIVSFTMGNLNPKPLSFLLYIVWCLTFSRQSVPFWFPKPPIWVEGFRIGCHFYSHK
jgi:hypothetical protein